MMKWKVMPDRVMVKPHDKEEISEGGIVIPENSQEQKTIGTVIAVGTSVDDVKIDDTVVYRAYTSPIEIDEVEYVILKSEDILAFK